MCIRDRANASSGIENTDKQLLEMASLFKVKTWRIWADIYWPSLRPYLLAAATTGLGLAWKSGITAEVIASPKFAIGSELQSAKVYLETPDIFVWTIVVVFLSIVPVSYTHLDVYKRQIQRHQGFCSWRQNYQYWFGRNPHGYHPARDC